MSRPVLLSKRLFIPFFYSSQSSSDYVIHSLCLRDLVLHRRDLLEAHEDQHYPLLEILSQNIHPYVEGLEYGIPIFYLIHGSKRDFVFY